MIDTIVIKKLKNTNKKMLLFRKLEKFIKFLVIKVFGVTSLAFFNVSKDFPTKKAMDLDFITFFDCPYEPSIIQVPFVALYGISKIFDLVVFPILSTANISSSEYMISPDLLSKILYDNV